MSLPETYNPFGKPIDEVESDDLETLRNVHEGWYVDYKAAQLNARGSAKAISAMANTYGGWVFIGVAEASKDHNVAGSFPGIAETDVDQCCQGIRQAVAEHLNPQPYFKLRTLSPPGSSGSEKVVCIFVPPSTKAPIIHSDGRIYRRINDSSEPVAENNREVVEHLFSRVDRFEKAYADWFDQRPELSKAEKDVSYLRIVAITDYWDDERLWFEGDVAAFREILRAKDKGSSFSQPFDSVFSQSAGFIARATQPHDARQITSTFTLRRDLLSDFVIPIPSYDVATRDKLFDDRPILAEAMSYLAANGHGGSTVLDLASIFGPIDSYFTLLRRFQKHVGYTGKTHVKYRLGNVWRRIPVLNLSPEKHGWNEYGIPMILTDHLASWEGGEISTFLEMDLHAKDGEENEGFLLSVPLFVSLCLGMGLGAGSNEEFSARVNSAMLSAFDLANKISS